MRGIAPTTSAGPIRAVLLECHRAGLDERAILCAAGLQAPDLDDPDRRFPGEAVREVWRLALEATGDEAIGLHAGEHMPWGEFGVPDFIAANAPTLRDGLLRLSRYFAIISEGGELGFEERRGLALLTYEDWDASDPIIRQIAEFSLTCVALRFKVGSGGAFTVRDVWFRHSRPASTGEHRRIFEAPVLFEQEVNALVLASETLDQPLSGNPHLSAIMEKVGEEQLSKLPGVAASIADRIRQRLRQHLDAGVDPPMAEVAQELGLSARTLQRRLRDDGVSFQDLREATRQELACHWLEQRHVAIAEVAFLLGFSEPSAFHRAFKRWTGETPAAYRERC